MTRVARVVVAVAALVAATVLGTANAPVATAGGGSTAVVVIDTGQGVRSQVIHFSGTINGITALQLAGGNPTTYGFAGQGAAVCAIDGVGNPADSSCLIGPGSQYWAYFVARGGSTGWTYSRGCACSTTLQNGDVDGWRYGTGAAPRASADFCGYTSCAPPPPPETSPPPPPPPATAAPSDGGSIGGSTAGTNGGSTAGPSSGTQPGGASGTVAPSGSADPGATTTTPDTPATDSPTSTTAPAPTSTSNGTSSGPRDRDGDQAQALVATHGGGDGGSGSPIGVAVAAGVLAAAVGGTVWIRRRRIRSASG